MSNSTSKAWRCTVCGYVHREPGPPENCPVCGAPRADFESYVEEIVSSAVVPVTQKTVNLWICMICQYVHEGPRPPEICPVCGAGADRFDPLFETEKIPVSPNQPIHAVIIGAGIAGLSAAETIRRSSTAARITLLSKEAHLPYYRLNLTRFLAGEISEKDLPVHPEEWYRNRQIDLQREVEVSAISAGDKTVELKGGKKITFDKLILAGGAHPFIPPINGASKKGVVSIRTLEDVRYVLEHLKPGARCVCIGGGILGLETAGALAKRGAEVTMLETFGWLMPRQLNPAAGALLAQYIAGLGIRLRAKAVTKEILGNDRVTGVLLEDGVRLPADLVVIAAGVRPNSHLARQAGLQVNNGIVVNDRLTTSHPDILAAGDVAEHRDALYGLWGPAQFQGNLAGLNAVGIPSDFGGIPRSNTLKVLGLNLLSIGKFQPDDGSYRLIEQQADGKYFLLVFRDSRLVGSILLGDTAISSPLKKAIETGTDFSALLQKQPTAQDVFQYLDSNEPLAKLPENAA